MYFQFVKTIISQEAQVQIQALLVTNLISASELHLTSPFEKLHRWSYDLKMKPQRNSTRITPEEASAADSSWRSQLSLFAKRITLARPMAKVWRTCVTKGAALGHAETNRKPTRKPSKAAAIRAAKKGRAASRAATGTIDATDTLRREPTTMSMEESSGAESRARQSNPTAVASQLLSGVIKAREKSDTLRAKWACPICSNVSLACFLRCSKCKFWRVRAEDIIERSADNALTSAITEANNALASDTDRAASVTI
ncbi:hypothetical protein GN244_ATG16364 [Phytophthora infestans]|uniref:RanBP2-type domain-containing protein n=1 Tax=Phytophthora infestans TaxID=4787 RepID=A0A833S3I3_PHYIN|nr:hypothetical protein GN244_ATG16364 [Phytophthora infestans]